MAAKGARSRCYSGELLGGRYPCRDPEHGRVSGQHVYHLRGAAIHDSDDDCQRGIGPHARVVETGYSYLQASRASRRLLRSTRGMECRGDVGVVLRPDHK